MTTMRQLLLLSLSVVSVAVAQTITPSFVSLKPGQVQQFSTPVNDISCAWKLQTPVGFLNPFTGLYQAPAFVSGATVIVLGLNCPATGANGIALISLPGGPSPVGIPVQNADGTLSWIAQPAPAPVPRMVIERFPLDPNRPQSQTQVTLNLQHTPAPQSALLMVLKGTNLLGDLYDAITAESLTTPKTVIETLAPITYPPDTQTLIVYWTLEP